MLIPFSDKGKIEVKQIRKRKSFIRLFIGCVTFEMPVRNLHEDVRQDLTCLACTGDIHGDHQLLNII